jgi:hypothetical protein
VLLKNKLLSRGPELNESWSIQRYCLEAASALVAPKIAPPIPFSAHISALLVESVIGLGHYRFSTFGIGGLFFRPISMTAFIDSLMELSSRFIFGLVLRSNIPTVPFTLHLQA